MKVMSGIRFIILSLFMMAGAAHAQSPQQKAPPTREEIQKELGAALQAALAASNKGPSEVKLGEQGKIALPQGYQFVPLAEARRLMSAFGNRTGDTFIGLVLSTDDKDSFIVTVNFEKAGYVKDDDAKNWKADELLKQLKDGTEEANADRKERGFPALEVGDWIEPPAYDPANHRLVWSVLVKQKGLQPSNSGSVNYNTYALGREGFYKLNLITGADTIGADKRHARTLLAALSYDDGKRYADFNPSTDRVAEYGLAALVAGVAAKKLGLLALIGVALAKFGKVIAIAVFGVGALFAKFFGRGGNKS